MHVLFLPSWYPDHPNDFNGSFFREQAETLSKAGFQVGVLALRAFPIYQCKKFFKHDAMLSGTVEAGVRVFRSKTIIPIPKMHTLNYLVLERQWKKLFQEYVSKYGTPDVLHAHSMMPAGIIASRISQKSGIPLVITEHRPTVIDRFKNGAEGAMALQATKVATKLIAVSPKFAKKLNETYELSVGSTTVWRSQSGVLTEDFEKIEPREKPFEPIVFGHVSHLDTGKKVDMLIDSFVAAFGADKNVKLHIIGSSPHLADLKEQAVALNASNIIFKGAIKREKIAEEFQKMHVFVLTSEAETFGTVFWEAMACGLPIIATKTWGGEFAIRGETGVSVPINDPEKLTEALTYMKNNLWNYDAKKIRQISLEECSSTAFVTKSQAVYQQAINGVDHA